MDELHRRVERRVLQELARLDELILAADREIEELLCAIHEARQIVRLDRPLTGDEQQWCLALREAGLPATEIARCLRVSVQSVQRTIGQFEDRDAQAA